MSDIFNTINSSTPNSVARAIANEIVAGKNAIAASIVNKGQTAEVTDTFESMAAKILNITGEVNVTPIQGIPSDWHDLAQVVAQNTLAEFPYSFAILLSKAMQSIQLTGSNRYITSDGGFFSGDRMHTFDVSKDTVGGDTYARFLGTLCGVATSVTVTANNVGSVGNVKLTGNGTSINALIAAWNTAHPTNQLTLTSGDGTQIPTAGFKGLVAGMTTVVEICENAGGDFGNITLVANGVKTIATLISEWNAANATKQLTLVSGSGTQIPTSNITLLTEDIQLTGGVIGNIGKSTRWVIFLNNVDNIKPSYAFNTTTNNEGVTAQIAMNQILINGIDMGNLNLNGVKISDLIIASCPNVLNLSTQGQLSGTIISKLIIPANVIALTIGYQCLMSSTIQSIVLPAGLKSLILPDSSFVSSSLRSLYIPDGVEAFSASYSALSVATLGYLRIGVPLTSFSISNNVFTACTRLYIVELGGNWNWTISLVQGLVLPLSHESILQNFNALVDYRADGVNIPTLQTNTANNVCIGTNTQFTKTHRLGDTFYVNGVAKVISSITDDTHIVMTTNGTSTASGLSYGSGKTYTVGAANLAKMSAAEKLIATNKGWTLA
ncbi:MAG TPA: hypothetical protein VI413_10790 [Paludibacter sp.]